MIARVRARPAISLAEAGAGRMHRRTVFGAMRSLHLRLRSTAGLVAEATMISRRAMLSLAVGGWRRTMLRRTRSLQVSAGSGSAMIARLEVRRLLRTEARLDHPMFAGTRPVPMRPSALGEVLRAGALRTIRAAVVPRSIMPRVLR